jgi:tRNA(His) guanylyltransferase
MLGTRRFLKGVVMSKKIKDALGDRMKSQYENRARHYFPRRAYTMVRVDGKAFHTWTRGLKRPYDVDFMECMDAVAIALCGQCSGAQLAFVQSDEVTVLLTDFSDEGTQAWFDGSQSKIESITASIATMAFNLAVLQLKTKIAIYGDLIHGDKQYPMFTKTPNAMFDSRAWSMADRIEVINNLIWRQKDAERNSVTMLASHYASHKELHGKNIADRHDAIHAAGDNWNNHPANFKRGRIIQRVVDENGRSRWEVNNDTPVFTKTPEFLDNLIPKLNGDTNGKA